MAATFSLKKSPSMKERMAETDPAEEANTFKKWMAGCYASLRIKWHITLKNGRK